MKKICAVAVRAMLTAGVSAAGFGLAAAQTQLPPLSVATPVAKPAPKSKAKAAPKIRAKAATAPVEPETPRIAEDAFVAVTVVPTEDVLATPGANLTDSLQLKPGIAGSTFAPGANRPIIRGLEGYRVRVQEDGIGSHDVSALSEDHAVPIDPLIADRIEVVRGPATLRYGSQAIGGVVNAINGRIPEIVPPKGISFAARGGLGSADRSADGMFKATAGAGNFALHADAFQRHAGDYDTPQGRQFNTFVDSEGFSVGGSVIGSDGFVGVAFSRFNSLYGIPGEEALEERTRIDMQQDKVLSRGEWRVKSGGVDAVRFWLGASDYAHDEIGFGSSTAGIGSHFTNREMEGRVEVQHQPALTDLGMLSGAVGVQFGNRKLTATSFEGDSLLEPATTRSTAAFWFEELQMTQKLRFQAAARIEQTAVDGIGLLLTSPNTGMLVDAERTFMPLSASAGVLYVLPGDVVARLTAQYVERAPDAGELFSKGLHDATGNFEIGNPDLAKEAAHTVELGFKKAKGAFRFDASAYATRFDGFIFRQLTGIGCGDTLATCGVEDELNQVLFLQRNATFYGLELQGEQDIGRVWRGVWGVDGQYDFVHAQFDDAQGGNVPRIPPHRLGAGVYYRDGSWLARLGILHAFDQDRVGENEEATKGYTLLNADLAYTFKLDGAAGGLVPEMTVGLKGENLLDNDVRNHASFMAHDVLLPGRTIRVYGTVELN
ncbi:MAG TPA: TonB-dependent receptor [Hyphomicrobiaceae bacterium]|nr:TonB-dependent receptor [Hyphomicrobiaceae bacterium]